MDKLLDFASLLIYGLLQGLTEVLPISSSGHLSLANTILPFPQVNLAIAAVFHAGSLLAIIWWFRKDLLLLWSRFLDSLKIFRNDLQQPKQAIHKLTAYQKMPYNLGISLIPTALIGLLLRAPAENVFAERLWTSAFLFVNGSILVITAMRSQSERTIEDLNLQDYLFIGFMQGLAVIPGISRLGITLCTCLIRKLGWYDSLRLSFLLSIPAIIGGLIIQLPSVLSNPPMTFTVPELITVVVFVFGFGLLGLQLLMSTLLEKKVLVTLGTYCCMLGAFSFAYLILGY